LLFTQHVITVNNINQHSSALESQQERRKGGKEERLMIKFSILYPNEKGNKFDMDYYVNSHIPMVMEKLGGAVKGGTIDQGLAGSEPGSPPIYVAMGHILFDSVEEFQNAMGLSSTEEAD
jgi:uncharacterized protein (TIGR02118 family)